MALLGTPVGQLLPRNPLLRQPLQQVMNPRANLGFAQLQTYFSRLDAGEASARRVTFETQTLFEVSQLGKSLSLRIARGSLCSGTLATGTARSAALGNA